MQPYFKTTYLRYSASWKKLSSTAGNNDRAFAEADTVMCYPVNKKRLIVTRDNKEIISDVQLFVDGPDAKQIKEGDLIQPPDFVDFRPVKRIDMYYNRFGELDYGVVYLV